jgi:hypothetical protein
MEGFAWSGADGSPHNTLPGNGWCLRDAICTLFGWPLGSPDWAAFQEYPSWGDTHRLLGHLGLVAFDPEQPHADELEDHPGVAFYALHRFRLNHSLYEPHIRFPHPLPMPYRWFTPELWRVAVDLRQQPHT